MVSDPQSHATIDNADISAFAAHAKQEFQDRIILAERCYNNPDYECLREIRNECDDLFKKLLLNKAEKGWLLLSLAEVTSNLIKHPNKKPTKILLTLALKKIKMNDGKTQETYILDIQDDSTPFILFEEKKQKSLALLDSKILSESGRGLGMLARAHPDHQYILKKDADDGLNHMKIRQPVNEDVWQQTQQKMHLQIDPQILACLNPKMPDLPDGWHGVMRSRAVAEAGGDFIFHHRKNGMTSLILADVMGHGAQAKFFSYAYAGYLRGLFYMMKNKRFRNPAMILRQMSKAVEDDPLLEHTMMTCLAMTLESKGQVSLASAGHPKPYIIRSDGSVMIDVGGALLGLNSQQPYKAVTYKMEKNERLLLMTDGFCENNSRPKSEEIRRQKIIKMVGKNSNKTIEEVGAIIWEEFLSWHEKNDIKDDASFILLEYKGGGDPPS